MYPPLQFWGLELKPGVVPTILKEGNYLNIPDMGIDIQGVHPI
jgi:hypothetical protein